MAKAKEKKKTGPLGWLFAIIVCIFAFKLFSGADARAPSQATAATPAAEPKKPAVELPALTAANTLIAEDAVEQYTKASHPKMFAKWGSDGLARVETHAKAAAEKVAASGKCDKVSLVGYSDQRSAPPSDISVFVDCDNGQRFYVSSDDMDSDTKPQSEIAVRESSAIQFCRNAVRSAAKFPSSVDFSMLGQKAYMANTTGNTVVDLDFEAKNELGIMIPQRATCRFEPGAKPTISITNR